MADEKLNIAAVVHAGAGEGDALVKEFVDELTRAGLNVQGLLTKHSKNPMIIYDISTGEEFTISQDLGKDSEACALNLSKLAEATSVIRKALTTQADLVIINRFGSSEVEGEGLVDEIQALMSHDIPVLTLTRHKYLPAWRAFTGGLGAELSLDKQQLHAWFNSIAKPAHDA